MIKSTKSTNSSKFVTIFMVVSSVGRFFLIEIKNQQVKHHIYGPLTNNSQKIKEPSLTPKPIY